MHSHHWAWQRQRPQHHVGAVRSYARDLDFYDLRGPNESPRGPCDQCAAVATDNTSLYLSFSSSDDDDDDDVLWTAAEEGKPLWPRYAVTNRRYLLRSGIYKYNLYAAFAMFDSEDRVLPVSYTHLTLPTIYSV